MPLKVSLDKVRDRLAGSKRAAPARVEPSALWRFCSRLSMSVREFRRSGRRAAAKLSVRKVAGTDNGAKRSFGAWRAVTQRTFPSVLQPMRVGAAALGRAAQWAASVPAAAFSKVDGLAKASFGGLKAGVVRHRWKGRGAEKRAKPAWEAVSAATPQAEKGAGLAEIFGLAIRLGLVALLIGAGLIIVFLNTDAGGKSGEELKRAAETGAVFSEPATTQPTRGNVDEAAAEGGVTTGDVTMGEGQKVAIIGSSRLLTPPVGRGAPELVRLVLVSPKRICKAIDPGEDFMSWNQSLLLDGHWECYASATAGGERVARDDDIEDAAVADDPEAVVEPVLPSTPQLFVMARGDERDTLTTVRIKLIADSAAKAKRGAARLAELTGALFDVLQWRPPDGLIEKLAGLQNFELDQAGTRLRFKRELSAGFQYNLIVIFPNPKIYSQGTAFQPPEATDAAGSPGALAPASRNDP